MGKLKVYLKIMFNLAAVRDVRARCTVGCISANANPYKCTGPSPVCICMRLQFRGGCRTCLSPRIPEKAQHVPKKEYQQDTSARNHKDTLRNPQDGLHDV